MRRLAVVVGCVLAGLAAGAIWTLLQSDEYRADARVLVRPASARVVPAVEALAESSLVATNIAQTLHLSSVPDISAERGDSGVLTVSATGGSRDRARQIDAEAVVVLMQKVQQRFATVHASTTVLDPAHVAEHTSPTARSNLLITGLAGLLVGVAVSTALSAGTRRRTTTDTQVEQRLQARIDQVARRERALAQRAGQLAARELDLERREDEVAADRRQAEELTEKQQELERREAELEAREAEPELPPSEPEPLPVARTGWDLRALEQLVAARADADPAQLEEWNAYLFYLREHADHDGKLPSSFDPLVAEVFGELTWVFSSSDERRLQR